MQAKILSSKEVEEVLEILEKNYGVRLKLKGFWFSKTKKDKLWIFRKEILEVLNKLPNVVLFGNYFGKLKRNKKIRLSIEGSQLIGNLANKNLILVDSENAKKYLNRYSFQPLKLVNVEEHNFYLVKFKDYFLGSCAREKGKWKSYFPKGRSL